MRIEIPPTQLRRRLRRVMRTLREEHGAMLLGSAARAWKTRDQSFPFRQNSDLFYLTGSRAPEMLLLVKGRSITLYAPPPDRTAILWEGPPPDYRRLAESLGAELVRTKTPEREIHAALRAVNVLYYQNAPGLESAKIAQGLFALPSHQRGALPSTFRHTDRILAPLRAHKDPSELALMRSAAQITCDALYGVLPDVRTGVSEHVIAEHIRSIYAARGASEAFTSIVAAGPSAAVLHYDRYTRTIRASDMVLFDIGAEVSHYGADLSRVIPTSAPTPSQRILYTAVQEAQDAAVRAVRPGVKVAELHLRAAEVLTEGLRALRILKGTTRSLMKKKAYKPYFPHGIGHPIGIDTHDVGGPHGDPEFRLERGMVFTIEPGLYLQKRTEALRSHPLPPCGVRIEDTVHVTEKGCEVLTRAFPTKLDEVLALRATLRATVGT